MTKRFINELIELIEPYLGNHQMHPDTAVKMLYVALDGGADEDLQSGLRNIFGEKNEMGKTNLGTTGIQLSKLNEVAGDLNANISEVNSDRLEKAYAVVNRMLEVKKAYDFNEDNVDRVNREHLQREEINRRQEAIKDAFDEAIPRIKPRP